MCYDARLHDLTQSINSICVGTRVKREDWLNIDLEIRKSATSLSWDWNMGGQYARRFRTRFGSRRRHLSNDGSHHPKICFFQERIPPTPRQLLLSQLVMNFQIAIFSIKIYQEEEPSASILRTLQTT